MGEGGKSRVSPGGLATGEVIARQTRCVEVAPQITVDAETLDLPPQQEARPD